MSSVFIPEKKMKMFSVFMIFVTLMAALSPETEAKSLGGAKLYRISGYHEEVLGLANGLFVGKWKEDQTKRQNLNDFLYYRGMLFPPEIHRQIIR